MIQADLPDREHLMKCIREKPAIGVQVLSVNKQSDEIRWIQKRPERVNELIS
jgi:hypothetical protein